MDRLLAATVTDPVAAAAGVAAMICLAAWPLFRARSAMLTTYVGNNLGFVAHYALLGQWTAAAMNGLMGVQTLVAMWLVRWPRLRGAYYALLPVLAAGTLVTWHGLPSFLAAVAATLSTIGRMQSKETPLRAWMLASTPFWAAHDVAVGSLPGLIADLLSMATGTIMLLRQSAAVRAGVIGARRRLRPAGWFHAGIRR
jgi:Bacterial inner membrane protein